MENLDFSKAFEWENKFYHTCDMTRISKIIAQYELYRMTEGLAGDIVECGVFKGTSLVRCAMMREIFGNPYSRKIIGFDTFGHFPESNYEPDRERREAFVSQAGSESISTDGLMDILSRKRCERNVELVKGDICQTVPEYVSRHPELRISLLNLDTDIYEPSAVIMEHLYPLIIQGGVLILDDYGEFPGETRAVDEYFKDMKITIQRFPFCMSPSFVVKE